MQLKKVKLTEITPYWRNPRDNSDAVEAVKTSIQQYGYNQPIVVDTDMVIVVGHTRYKALVQLGHKEAQVVILDLPPEKAKEYRIADNKTSEFAVWDDKALIEELREIGDLSMLEPFFAGEDLQGMISDSIGETNFSPVTQKQIDRAEIKENDTFEVRSQLQKEEMLEIICPHCSEPFHISRQDVATRGRKEKE